MGKSIMKNKQDLFWNMNKMKTIPKDIARFISHDALYILHILLSLFEVWKNVIYEQQNHVKIKQAAMKTWL